MTASRIPPEPQGFTSPIIDYEPAPAPLSAEPCPQPSPAALHRRAPRRMRYARPTAHEPQPPRDAVVFADAALRRVLEVIDRRRPVAQLRPLVTPALIDSVVALARSPRSASATLRRVRLRIVDESCAGELFATYTRGPRVHAIAGRVELTGGRWRIVALQIG